MKIAAAQIRTDPGKLVQNTDKIIESIRSARVLGAELVVFPELAIPGYALMDLAHDADYVEQNLLCLDRIVKATEGIAVIVGFIDREAGAFRPGERPLLYNAAAVISDGKLIGVQHKSLVPDYGIFFEQRYFAPGKVRKIFELYGKRIGLQICEDLWDRDYSVKVSDELVQLGAEILINISASPFHLGKLEDRRELVEGISKRHSIPFVYCNLVGSFDGYEGEVVFDGRSFVCDTSGTVRIIGKSFEEDFVVVDTTALPIGELPSLHPTEELLSALVLGVREYFRRTGLLRAYVGLSGGIDSAVVACIAAGAVAPEQVIGITMPSHITSKETLADAFQLAKNLGIACWERPIVPEYSAWTREFTSRHGRAPAPLTQQNKQARIRGSILMEYTNEDRAALVINTGNKTELALGYCTLYGDMCGGLAAIGDVSKDRVYELARYINLKADREVIPQSIIDRVPTAELEVDQTDRANLPADYPVLSPLVDRIIEDGATYSELIKEYPKELVNQTLRLIDINEFKRRQAPPGIRVTPRAFGVGRRVPMGHRYAGGEPNAYLK